MQPPERALVETSGPVRIRPTRVEIDADRLIANARWLRAHTGTGVCAVVKADGYGHGAIRVARALTPHVEAFAVSLVEEGVSLRDAGVRAPVLVMGPSQHGGADELLGRDLSAVISHAADWHELEAAARRRGRDVDVHLKIDTGMGRLGLGLDEAIGLVAQPGRLRVTALMTHFACADVDDPTDAGNMTYAQVEAFEQATGALRAAGAPIRMRHAANSSGAMMFPTSRYDLVRTGLALYGNGRWPTDVALPDGRRQAMRLVTAVAQVRTIASGHSVGYGATWTAPRDTDVAVLPLGYADGLARRASGHAFALIDGVRCPLVGAVSMDIVVADISAHPRRVREGAEAVLLGHSELPAAAAPISTAEYASWTQQSEYEVTCGMSKRVPRVYLGGELR